MVIVYNKMLTVVSDNGTAFNARKDASGELEILAGKTVCKLSAEQLSNLVSAVLYSFECHECGSTFTGSVDDCRHETERYIRHTYSNGDTLSEDLIAACGSAGHAVEVLAAFAGQYVHAKLHGYRLAEAA